ncbi:MAG: IclR family transcriptional regulator [Desulfobacterales bacterium]
MVKSADRTILILEAVARRNEGVTHGDLSEMLRIPKSSLSSLLANLQNRDYLFLDRRNKRYTLGPKILFLAGSYLSSTDIVQRGRPVIDKLMAQTEESAGLTIKKGSEILTVYNKNSPLPIIRSLQIGDRAPIYATAAGRVILAYLPDAEIDHYLATADMKPLTAKTITEPDRIRLEIKAIRKMGVAFCREEFHEGSTAMAAPVFDMHGMPIASIHVAAPSTRFNARKEKIIADALRQSTKELSYRLGFGKDDRNSNSENTG